MNDLVFKPGDAAQIRRSMHSPYSGRTGVVMDIDVFDAKGPYLLVFSDGLQFRYKAHELERVAETRSRGVIDTVQRVIHETRQGFWRITHSR